jgi:hypothetical protein
MAHMGRPGLSAAQKADLWHRWKEGQSLSEIGRALGKHAGSIHGVVSSNGGVTPAVRKRSRWALTLAEREEISRGLATAPFDPADRRHARSSAVDHQPRNPPPWWGSHVSRF